MNELRIPENTLFYAQKINTLLSAYELLYQQQKNVHDAKTDEGKDIFWTLVGEVSELIRRIEENFTVAVRVNFHKYDSGPWDNPFSVEVLIKTLRTKDFESVVTIYKDFNLYGSSLWEAAKINWCAMGSQPQVITLLFKEALDIALAIAEAADKMHPAGDPL